MSLRFAGLVLAGLFFTSLHKVKGGKKDLVNMRAMLWHCKYLPRQTSYSEMFTEAAMKLIIEWRD